MVERILQWANRSYGIRYACLRYFNAAGADHLLRSGEKHTPETHLIPLALMAATGLSSKLTIFGNDYDTHDGTAVRDYVHVSDIASGHVRAMDALNTIECFEANIGTGRGNSVMEVVRSVERVLGRSVPFDLAMRRDGDPAMLVANPEKFMKLTGWSPKYTNLDEIVETAFRWTNKSS